MTLLLWILGSLLAISFIGDLPGIALILAGLTGFGMGLSVITDNAVARLTLRNLDHQVSQAALRLFPSSVFNVPMMALIIMLLLSLWVSPDVMTSYGPLLQLLVGIGVFYILSDIINTANRLYWAVCGLVALGVLIALLVPISIGLAGAKFWPFTQVPESIRQILSIRLNPNSLAGGLIPILSITTALFLHAPLEWLAVGIRGHGRLVLAIALIAMSTTLLLTQSRGGIFAMGVALVLLITSKRWWIGGTLVGTFVLLILVGNNGTAISRLLDFSVLTSAVDGLPNREEIWWRAVFMLQRVPYTGIGLGAFSRAVTVLYPMLVNEPQVDLYHAHNLYLQVSIDLGIPGLAAFISILVVALGVTARRVYSMCRNRWTDQYAVLLGLGSGLIAVIVHGFVDCPLWDYNPAIILWIVMGLIGAVAKSDWTETRFIQYDYLVGW